MSYAVGGKQYIAIAAGSSLFVVRAAGVNSGICYNELWKALVLTSYFFYGTLKRGCRSHSRLANSPLLGLAWTKPRYRLYNCGTYPGLVAAADGESVGGELYRVNSEVIAALDEFESNYQRMPIDVIGPVAEAWGYIYLGDISALSPCGPVWTDV